MPAEGRARAPGATDLGGSSNYPSDNPWGQTRGRFPGQTAFVPGSVGPEPPVRILDRDRSRPAGPPGAPPQGGALGGSSRRVPEDALGAKGKQANIPAPPVHSFEEATRAPPRDAAVPPIGNSPFSTSRDPQSAHTGVWFTQRRWGLLGRARQSLARLGRYLPPRKAGWGNRAALTYRRPYRYPHQDP